MSTEQIQAAAKFYLKSQGLAGTAKQVEKLMKNLTPDSILFMAKQRGYTAMERQS